MTVGTFLARLEWDRDSGLVVYTAPGVESIDRSILREGACDHCKIDRYRKNVYLIENDNGKTMQVGSTCLKDFLGWNVNPVWIATPSENDLFGSDGFGYVEPTYSTETILAAAWACIQEFGYVRASDFNGCPTKYTVADVLEPRNEKSRELARLIAPRIPDAIKQASLIREWILSDEFSGNNEYVINLKNICAGEFCSFKKLGFLVSAPQAWAKGIERSLIRKRESAEINNTYGGEIGEKLELTVTLKSIRYTDGYYGTTSIYTFAGADNRIYVWFSSRNVWSETTDEPMTIKGTVKKHSEFRDVKQTVLTRVKEM